ncbi:DUF2637 domain-containing protein [Nonomuraea rubra]
MTSENPTCTCNEGRSPLPDRRIHRATTATVIVLAAIAAAISYRHLHMLAMRHGETAWSAALLPISVDGMILAASLTLLADSRRGRRGGPLPWGLLILGSLASVGANIAVAEPSLIGRIVAAWPAIALIGGMELAFKMVRSSVARSTPIRKSDCEEHAADEEASFSNATKPSRRTLQRQAWEWADQNRAPDGTLPRSADLARRFQRSLRWARLVKASGAAGRFAGKPAS